MFTVALWCCAACQTEMCLCLNCVFTDLNIQKHCFHIQQLLMQRKKVFQYSKKHFVNCRKKSWEMANDTKTYPRGILPKILEVNLCLFDSYGMFLLKGIATWLLCNALLNGLFVRLFPMSLCASYRMRFLSFHLYLVMVDVYCWIWQREAFTLRLNL